MSWTTARGSWWVACAIACVCAMSFGGCSCGHPVATGPDGSVFDAGGRAGKDAPPASQSAAKEYIIRGVATLTFYPNHADKAREGAFGGYVLLYDKPQKTRLLFSNMADDTCEFAQARKSSRKVSFAGLHAGDALTINIEPYSWKLPINPMNPTDASRGSFYPIPSVEKMTYPYRTSLTIRGEGGDDVGPMAFQLDTPSRLQIESPKILRSGSVLPLERDLPLKWRFDGDVPFLSVRINQYDPDADQTISLSCRFANDGEASIPADLLKSFKRDPEGKRTHIFFFSGNYQFFKLPDFEEPIMAVVEAITTSPVLYK